MRDLGLAAPGPLQDTAVLDEIDEALAPAQLPTEVRRLWELIDADALVNSVRTYPQLANPRFCLWARVNLDEPEDFSLSHPRHFFQIFYTSHDEMSVECDGPDWEGGGLLEWFLSDPGDPFVLHFRSIVDWLEVLLAALAEGAYQDLGNSILLIDHARHEQLAAQRLASGPSHPDYGTGIVIPRDRTQWPDHWLQREQRLLAEPEA
jgi:hypothetical protein